MEIDTPHTPSFFSAALAADNQNVFDQSFAAMVPSTGQLLKRDWTTAPLPHFIAPVQTPENSTVPRTAPQYIPRHPPNNTFRNDTDQDKTLDNLRQSSIDPRIMKSEAQFIPGYACVNHRQITPASSTESNTPDGQSGPFNMLNAQINTKSAMKQTLEITSHLGLNEQYSQESNKKAKQTAKSRKGRKRLNLTEEAANSRRDRLLERNRLAASKCRDKKKEWTSSLESQARELQASKDSLSELTNSLKDELLFLKTEMLKHTDCGCNEIRDYLKCQAQILTHHDVSQQHGNLESSSPGSPTLSQENDQSDLDS